MDITFLDFDDGSHPFHLHGHTFWLLGTGEGYFASNTSMNATNPVRRDTAGVYYFFFFFNVSVQCLVG
jgi:FtsP/CotA-like multicopper oxidase with cupredoxin domain